MAITSQDLKVASKATEDFYHEVFDLFDKDKDKIIGVDDFKSAAYAFGYSLSDDEARNMLKLIDLDGNGAVNFAEFLHVMVTKLSDPSHNAEIVKETFKQFDRDHNGFVDPEELRDMAARLGVSISSQEVDEIIECSDTSRDGLLDYDEFTALMIGRTEVNRIRDSRSRNYSRKSNRSRIR